MAIYDLKKFSTWIDKTTQNIDSAIKETDEMQTAFNSEYVNRLKLEYDSILDGLADETTKLYFSGAIDRSGGFGKKLAEKIKVKSGELAKRKSDLEKQLYEIENLLISIKADGEKSVEKLKKANPKLNEQEEELKAIVARHEGAAITLKNNIAMLRRGLGFIFNYFTISKLRANLLEEVEKIKQEKKKLYEVRKKYFEMKSAADEKKTELEKNFADELPVAAAIRSELGALQNGFEAMCVRDAAADLFEETPADQLSDIAAKLPALEKLLKLRPMKHDYEKSLRLVAEEIGFLNGVKSGFLKLLSTANSLLSQYNQHSAYLKPIAFDIPDKCEAFSAGFLKFADKIVDDRSLSKTPADFLKLVEPFHRDLLNEKTVKSAFEDIGAAIKKATAAWK